jgi:tRNA(Ile)-lysidine synthase
MQPNPSAAQLHYNVLVMTSESRRPAEGSRGRKGLVARVDEYIRRHALLQPKDALVVAVSGGPDSVALLHILVELQPVWDLRLLVCHLDHRLRPGESARDAQFVARLAGDLGLPAVIEECDVAARARSEGVGLEEAGRKARYAFFEQSRILHQADLIALGHTADDQVETVLHHLLRGSGLRGLGGMAPARNGLVVRPLLGVWRSEITRYLGDRNLPYRTDASNSDTLFVRNRIRHNLLPSMRQACGPGIDQAIHRLAVTAREDHQYIEMSVLQRSAQMLKSLPDGSLQCPARELLALPAALRRRLILRAFQLCSPAGSNWDFAHVERVLGLAVPGQSGKSVPLPYGLEVTRQFDQLSFQRQGCKRWQPFEFTLTLPGKAACPEYGWELSALPGEPEPLSGSQHAGSRLATQIALNPRTATLMVRSFRDGDRWSPDSNKKVKEHWNSCKVPQLLRRQLPLVYSGDRLLWIPGLPQPALPAGASGTAVHLEFRFDPGTALGGWLRKRQEA